MPDKWKGLYYESMDIRNHVLSRNIGRYRGYKWSLLLNGGRAIGMPYAVENELVPVTLSERSNDEPGINNAEKKPLNPLVNTFFREGGLYGYTHEVINKEDDWLSRNQNILQTFYDYGSTEDLNFTLSRFPNSLPWNDGLRAYSHVDLPHNTVHFSSYPLYIKSLFPITPLSFEKMLGEGYVYRLMHFGFATEDISGNATDFINEKAGYITDDTMFLKNVPDTKLGYIGRIMLDESKYEQILNDTGKSVSTEKELPFRPGINNPDVNLWGPGISYQTGFGGTIPISNKFIKDISDTITSFDEPDESLINTIHVENVDPDGPQRLFLKRTMRRNRYKGLKLPGDFSGGDSYADYYNVTNLFLPPIEIDGEEISEGSSISLYNEGFASSSVEGFFKGAGVYDMVVKANDHYDEQDTLNSGERDILSEKISYDQPENIGIGGDLNGNGFSSKENSLLQKTKKLFEQHKIKTLVGRFHTSEDDKGSRDSTLTQTATNETYGLSHGRNLLKLNPTRENGYDNPYCRVWTYHHQYAKMTDLIRPFTDGNTFMSLDALQAAYPGRPILREGGRKSWADKTVLNKNGMVNIAPTKRIGRDIKEKIHAKQCMFSIENLAWKGVNKTESIIDTGEIGPLGGRIMWFPPYNLSFNESVNVSWGANDFIGRGEKIYSYTNTDRTGTLSFTILADHPSILDYWMNDKQRRENPGTEEDQQTVLRFFAGCENLEAAEQVAAQEKGITKEYYAIKENQKNEPKDEQDETVVNEDETINEEIAPGPPEEFTKDNSISFYVYFPNNLSCIDFIKNPKVGVNYLVNGKNGFEFNPDLGGTEMTIGSDGNGSAILPTETAVIGKWAQDIFMSTPGNPGYEMGRGWLTDDETTSDVIEYNSKSTNDKGRNYMWGYGIDTDKVKERLCGPHGAKGDKTYKLYPKNYCDSADFRLNAKPNELDDSCGYSFMDVAAAITTDYKYNGKGEDATRVDRIKEILGLKGEQVKKTGGRKYFFAIAGGASIDGYEDKNAELSRRRANFLRAWLENCFTKLNLEIDYAESDKIRTETGIDGGDGTNVNSLSAKRGRFAKAVIYWNDEDVKDATDAEQPYEEGDNNSASTIVQETVIPDDNGGITEEDAAESTTYQSVAALTNRGSTRYRDEEEFFDKLEENDPVMYKNIIDKVKYFDPVYHSITPEGFNSRLSFLHQCTRQGPTMSSSDLSQNSGFNGAGYAGNLSFGRAPVCVLRLGDFFNTRIIINSVQIQYETGQWDLNPEGIGVQPMLANVTISFVFQGGQSLGGPIQRLQNAVSFNYYANQEVYDDRADVAVYKEIPDGGNGELDEEASYVWIPGYGNMNIGDVSTAIRAKELEINPVEETTVEKIKEDKYISEKERLKREAAAAQTRIEEFSQRESSGGTETEQTEQQEP